MLVCQACASLHGLDIYLDFDSPKTYVIAHCDLCCAEGIPLIFAADDSVVQTLAFRLRLLTKSCETLTNQINALSGHIAPGPKKEYI